MGSVKNTVKQIKTQYILIRQCLRACAPYAARVLLIIPKGIGMVSVCTGLLGKEGRVNIAVDKRL